MQNNIVKAFRMRLIRNGFTNVSIDFLKFYGVYHLSCLSPNGQIIIKNLSLTEMSSIPGIHSLVLEFFLLHFHN